MQFLLNAVLHVDHRRYHLADRRRRQIDRDLSETLQNGRVRFDMCARSGRIEHDVRFFRMLFEVLYTLQRGVEAQRLRTSNTRGIHNTQHD